MPKIRNIIIFVIIVAIFVAIYFFYKKQSSDKVPASNSSAPISKVNNTAGVANSDQSITREFLTLLLSVKDIKLNDAIFSDKAFLNLDPSHSITLSPDGNEGRINPFAPLGSDVSAVIPAVCILPEVLNTATNTCVTPPTCASPKVLDPATNTCVNSPLISL